MKALMVALAAGALLTVPMDALAQSGRASGTARGGVEQRREGRVYGTTRDRRDDRYERDRYERRDRYDDRYRDRRNGPKFCQNGQGHPVHGRAWCRQKGFDLGRGYQRDRWDRVSWEDVIFQRRDRRYDSRLGSDVLRDVLGGRVYGRLDDHRRSSGYADGLFGTWARSGSGHILNVFAGGVPIAQLIDANLDGRAETVLLNRR
jgi:hypothetical protein